MHHCFILIAYNNRCEFNMVFFYILLGKTNINRFFNQLRWFLPTKSTGYPLIIKFYLYLLVNTNSNTILNR